MPKAAYTGVAGVARKNKKAYVGVSGVAKKVKSGYVGVSGVARLFFEKFVGLYLTVSNNRTGCTVSKTLTSTAVGGKVSGGSNSGWAVLNVIYGSDGEFLKLPAGTTIKYSFTGTRAGSYCDYGLVVRTVSSDYTTNIHTYSNSSATNRTYTLPQDAYVMLYAEVGGVSGSNLYASINVTKFEIDGVQYFPGEVREV